MRYPIETFTEAEQRALEPHFTNLDRPVFALTNLAETVKGALFARYSRYGGTLRRLYLDEFAADAPAGGRPFDGAEGERAAQLYERIFIGYGDDSVAQLGGAHLACEWVSNVLTKVLQRGRLAAYLEQSTRYIAYDAPMDEVAGGSGDGRWRYWRGEDPGPEYTAALDEIFAIYSRSLRTVRAWAEERWPRGEEPQAAWERSIRAKALDLLRGLLPAATLSHVGIYASGQAYEQLLLRLLSSPLPEARDLGGMALTELGAVIPSFISRVERPERRGGSHTSRDAGPRLSAGSPGSASTAAGAPMRGGRAGPRRGSERTAGSLAVRASGYRRRRSRAGCDPRPDRARGLVADLVAPREPPAPTGRGWESVRYRFEIVSANGGFRDMQRHRMLTCQCSIGPAPRRRHPGELRERAPATTTPAARALRPVRPLEASGMRDRPSALCLGLPIRYVLDLTAREAMHVCELRPDARAIHLPRGRPGDARADQRRPPRDRRRDATRRRQLGRG